MITGREEVFTDILLAVAGNGNNVNGYKNLLQKASYLEPGPVAPIPFLILWC